MKILEELEQGSPEWFAARLGKVTASEFKTVLSKGRGSAPSKTRRTYMLKLAGEILTGELQESFSNPHMERGQAMEGEARDLYSLVTGNDVKEVGFITGIDGVGYSPDGLVGDDGLLEIKTKLPHLQIDLLLRDEVPSEHIYQCQGGLWVSDRDWIDFVSYWPGLPIFIKRINRDPEVIAKIRVGVDGFLADLHETVKNIKNMEG